MNNENQIGIGQLSDAKATSTDNAKSRMNDSSNAPLKKFFVDALKDMLWGEKAITSSLKKLQNSVSNEELQDAFQDHEFQTQKHIARLEKVFGLLGERADTKKCKALEGILKEVDEMIESTPEGSATRDAVAIIGAQKVEHYEIACYGGLVAIAHTLGMTRAADLLQKSLEEEEQTDYDLTDIAECKINFEAKEEAEAKEPVEEKG